MNSDPSSARVLYLEVAPNPQLSSLSVLLRSLFSSEQWTDRSALAPLLAHMTLVNGRYAAEAGNSQTDYDLRAVLQEGVGGIGGVRAPELQLIARGGGGVIWRLPLP